MNPKQSSSTRNWLDAWHVNPSSNIDYLFIDGLRGIAVLLVVVGCHLIYVNPEGGQFTRFAGGLFNAGGVGVPIFFCISGFVISLPFWKYKIDEKPSFLLSAYFWRRFWKIYPPLLVSIVLFTPIYIFRSGDWSYIKPAIEWLSGVAFFLPVNGKLNPVVWSLAVEVQFYIVIPFIFILLKQVSTRACLWLIAGTFLILPNLFRWYVYGGHGPAFHPMINTHFPAGLDAFALGILLAGMERLKITPKSFSRLGVLGFVLILLVMISKGFGTIHPYSQSVDEIERWVVMLGAGCLLCFAANPNGMIARMLCGNKLRWFGLISYELYLLHQPIFLWARNYFGPSQGSILKYTTLLLSSFILSVLLSACVYKYLSLPILIKTRKN
ncbi:MAG: acyltransferase [bacterium]